MNALLLALALAAGPFELEGNALKVPGPVLFEPGTDRLKSDSEAALQHVAAYLEAKSYITLLRVEAHSDATGAAAANQALTEKRALAVARWLVGHGVDCRRLLPVGFGESKPRAPNDTPEGKAANRRVEFVNAALRGRPIGGLPVDGGGRVAGDACAR